MRPALSILTPVLKDERDGVGEILLALLNGLTLTVRPRTLRAIPDVPLPVPLNDGGELVVEGELRHELMLLPE